MARVLGWLAHALLGHRCETCGERMRGWRTLLAHIQVEHAGDRTADTHQEDR